MLLKRRAIFAKLSRFLKCLIKLLAPTDKSKVKPVPGVAGFGVTEEDTVGVAGRLSVGSGKNEVRVFIFIMSQITKLNSK